MGVNSIVAESLSAAAASEEGSLIGVVAGNSGVGIVEGGPRDEGEEPRSSRDQQHAEPKGIPAKFLQAISADLSTRLDPKVKVESLSRPVTPPWQSRSTQYPLIQPPPWERYYRNIISNRYREGDRIPFFFFPMKMSVSLVVFTDA